MRHTFELTDETRKVLSGNVGRTAEEAHVSDKYLYGILAGTQTDPFAPFEHLYAAAVRAGNPVSLYDSKLAAIRARNEKPQPSKPIVQCLTEKLHEDTELATQLIEAMRDGEITADEAEQINPAIDRARSILDLLETHIQFKRNVRVM
jgi:hypothetical protein